MWTGAMPLNVGQALAILTPIVIVPLGVITFYLRALRDHQIAGRNDLTRRIERAESGLRKVSHRVTEIERDYAVKEDWLRESMLARANIERLSEGLARLEAGADRRLVRLAPGRLGDGAEIDGGTD
jgi:hypothetical protein